jgi:hypothetical protein
MEELGQPAKQQFEELLRGHRRAVGMPERRHHHVLDGALFPVGQFHFRLFLVLTNAIDLAANRTWLFCAFARRLAADLARFRRRHHIGAGMLPASRARLFFLQSPVPLIRPGSVDAPSRNRRS